MRQQRWIELFSDYDYEIRYHSGKTNRVVDAFSRKEMMKPRRVRAMSMTIRSSVTNKILAAQDEASKVGNATTKMLHRLDQQIEKKEDGGLYFIDQGWDFNDRRCKSVRNTTRYEYGLSSSNRWRKRCSSPVLWAEIKKILLIGPELVQETTDKGGVVRFEKKGKLATRYVGPFEILERIGPVAYFLRLPQELSSVHDTFHVLNLKKCLADANLHVPLGEIKIAKTLCFVEEPVVIMDREVKKLKRIRI
uniref:Tf2-1-like SH3-like domain-containing protein n=1 Tax=Tanacetum cinerariifolium TaxID=118510 RepID=A0A699ICY3_TANCI|nr:hypothetical protein [Tanacetum cinerariifolium]